MTNPKKISGPGIALIKSFERFVPHAYDDRDPKHPPLTEDSKPRGVVTIGYGHTGRHARIGNIITENEAVAILMGDLSRYEKAVSDFVKVPVRQGQFDAMVSLCFNIGIAGFKRSTVLRKLNDHDDYGAAEAFLMWVKDGGKVLDGLVRRRKAERELFLEG